MCDGQGQRTGPSIGHDGLTSHCEQFRDSCQRAQSRIGGKTIVKHERPGHEIAVERRHIENLGLTDAGKSQPKGIKRIGRCNRNDRI